MRKATRSVGRRIVSCTRNGANIKLKRTKWRTGSFLRSSGEGEGGGRGRYNAGVQAAGVERYRGINKCVAPTKRPHLVIVASRPRIGFRRCSSCDVTSSHARDPVNFLRLISQPPVTRYPCCQSLASRRREIDETYVLHNMTRSWRSFPSRARSRSLRSPFLPLPPFSSIRERERDGEIRTTRYSRIVALMTPMADCYATLVHEWGRVPI